MWREYWTKGTCEVVDYSADKRYIILVVKDFNLHPLYCLILAGFFEAFSKIVVGEKVIDCKETKCPFRSDKYKIHEYLINWGN